MSCGGDTIERVKLSRCIHGVYHLFLGGQTIHLTTRELALIRQAIDRWASSHPEFAEALRVEHEPNTGEQKE